jgi:ubiquinone/menaquinone biosynthesis C-methylase UbiE
MKQKALFDAWPEKYDQWFRTPIGRLVKMYERELLMDLLRPGPGETILDAGCGTGVFTLDMLAAGPRVVAMDISLPMLVRAGKKAAGCPISFVAGDMMALPFADRTFDKVVSVTALEFIEDGKGALSELFRVTKHRGWIVVATLNSLSPWTARRAAQASRKPDSIFKRAIFRSPEEMAAIAPVEGVIKTAVHFQKDDEPERAERIELEGRARGLETGAFLVGRWERLDHYGKGADTHRLGQVVLSCQDTPNLAPGEVRADVLKSQTDRRGTHPRNRIGKMG